MTAQPVSALQIFKAFGLLGLTSFGGPIAHLGYFRADLVERRKWMGEADYADLVALCQFLPGPASSQVGLGIGYRLAGLPGALAAWTGFTLPSALLLGLLGLSVAAFDHSAFEGAMHALKVLTVAVVAQAVIGMGKSLTPDLPRGLIALGGLAVVFLLPGAAGQIAAIAGGALAGLVLSPGQPDLHPDGAAKTVPRGAVVAFALFLVLLIGLPLVAAASPGLWLEIVEIFYRAGALVFGGGHVVLPLIEASAVPDLIPEDRFLAGYGAAQAVPGPLFTFAAFVGAASPAGVAGGALALLAIFLPGALLVLAALPVWDSLKHRGSVRRALTGINAAVVGLLLAALIDPIARSALGSVEDGVLALIVFGLLMLTKIPVWLIVLTAAGLGAIIF